jgi:hypothetical protein
MLYVVQHVGRKFVSNELAFVLGMINLAKP